jgi:hypothetical protein
MFEMKDRSRQSYGSLTALVVPAIESSRNAMNRIRGLSRGVRIVNALIAQDVQDPAVDLTTLGLPPDALVNPFTGEPLKHRKTELGWKPRYADLESIVEHAWRWEMEYFNKS